MTSSPSAASFPRRLLRSWLLPLAIVLAAATYLCFVIWADEDRLMLQEKYLRTMSTGGGAVVLALAWFVFLAPARKRVRLGVMFTLLLPVVAAMATLTIDGVDGDLKPIFRLRWQVQSDRAIAPLVVQPPKDSAAGAGTAAKPQEPESPTVAAGPTPAAPSNDPSAAAAPPLAKPAVPAATNVPAVATTVAAAAFPQFLGPHRNGVIDGIRLEPDWAAHPPRVLWRQPIGAGWSGFAVAGQRAITQEQRGEEELVVCYDLATGTPLWSHVDRTRYETTIAGPGPRCTPSVDLRDGGRVYTLGGTGIFNCLDLITGRRLWSHNILSDTGANVPQWGASGSPLIEGDMVILNPGGSQQSIIAYHLLTGEKIWAGGSDEGSYASPMIATLAGVRQLVMVNQFSCTGHSLDDGRVLWRHDWPGRNPKVAQPLPLGNDRLLLSAGYGVGSEAIQVNRDAEGQFTTQSLWKNIRLKAKFTNLVLHQGHVFGLDDGKLVCLNADTGERTWVGERYGHGQLLLVGDLLLIQAEPGHIALAVADPLQFKELARFDLLADKTWNNPTLAGDLLLVRNDREAACVKLPVK